MAKSIKASALLVLLPLLALIPGKAPPAVPQITQFSFHAWTGAERAAMSTNGIQNAGMSSPSGGWTPLATLGQVRLTFTTPSLTNVYHVEWQPWRVVSAQSFAFAGITYDGKLAQRWTDISGALYPTGASLTFVSGVVESPAYFRIRQQ